MKKPPPQPRSFAPAPRKFTAALDTFLLFVCAGLVAARCQMNESFGRILQLTGPSAATSIATPQTSAMLIFAGLIFSAALLWLLVHLRRGALLWKKTSLLIPLALLLAAAVISTLHASNKNIALIAAINLLAQVVLAILLVQLLDRPWKQSLLLCVLAATGVTMAYRCWEQHHYEIPSLLDLYQTDPNQALEAQGLEPDSYEADMFIARLASGDIGGYFAISNTAAAFFILSISAALALLLGRIQQQPKPSLLWLLPAGLALVQIAALWITQSKGGLIGFAATVGLLALLLWQRKFLARHWRSAVAAAVILILLSVAAIIGHGLAHNRLPTNSLWVRWQYWHSTARMIADHWFAGVGPENFGLYYPRYMPAGVPEVVKDPHCFALALWSQWGLLGILGFGWALVALALRLLKPPAIPPVDKLSDQVSKPPSPSPSLSPSPPPSTGLPNHRIWLYAAALALAVTFIRLLASDLSGAAQPVELVSVLLLYFFMPALVWLVSLVLLLLAAGFSRSRPYQPLPVSSFAVLTLGCGLAGFLLHNAIDFAVFQPGVGSFFFATIALALAARHQNQPGTITERLLSPRLRAATALLAALVVLAFWLLLAVPICRANAYLRQAQTNALRAYETQRSLPSPSPHLRFLPDYSAYIHKALTAARQAARINPLDPEGPHFIGRLQLLLWQQSGAADPHPWRQAIDALLDAQNRDPQNFRYDRLLSAAYRSAYQQSPTKPHYLQSAQQHLQQALERHPHDPPMLLESGQLLARQNQTPQALRQYQKALAAEQAFLDQQRQMHPGPQNFKSRLTPDQHRWLKNQIRKLTPPPAP